MHGQRPMAEHGPIATGEDGGEPTTENVDARDANRVDATMEGEQTVGPEPVPNGLARQPCSQQLASCNHPVLARREPDDARVDALAARCLTFWFAARCLTFLFFEPFNLRHP